MIKKFFLPAVVPLAFLLDRASKILVLKQLSTGQTQPVIPGVFHLTRVNNPGAAFGILKNSILFLQCVSWISVIALGIYLFRGFRRGYRSTDLGWALIVGGAAGNLYDRVHFGYVIDFLDFRVWPVFNLADSFISVGVFLILAGLFQSKKQAV